jgi:hypothetical protein
MSLFNSPDFRLMCELAGAKYLGVCDGVILFEDPKDGAILRIYEIALRSPDDIKEALKNHREPVCDFKWQEVTENERG